MVSTWKRTPGVFDAIHNILAIRLLECMQFIQFFVGFYSLGQECMHSYLAFDSLGLQCMQFTALFVGIYSLGPECIVFIWYFTAWGYNV